jgi:hypothetical protein
MRERLALALTTWHADFQAASEAIVRESGTLLSPWIATTTRSSLVERALLEAHAKGRGVKVLLSESRPMNEGLGLARALAEAGVPSWLAVDAALPLLLPQAGAVWIGVDAVREKTFVTKAGTYALLLVARELNVPAYAFAQRAKFLPDRCTRLTLPAPPRGRGMGGCSAAGLGGQHAVRGGAARARARGADRGRVPRRARDRGCRRLGAGGRGTAAAPPAVTRVGSGPVQLSSTFATSSGVPSATSRRPRPPARAPGRRASRRSG